MEGILNQSILKSCSLRVKRTLAQISKSLVCFLEIHKLSL